MKYLNLTRCHSITSIGINHICKSFSLKKIILECCKLIDDKCLEYLSTFDKLDYLNIHGCKLITYKGLINLIKNNWIQIDDKILIFKNN